eukprot:TRINITY_DN6195_c0_g1_i1.p1 TRINITY_DN6195_c0_g1~~TRINITY_DN6195_c0_g1_i1.p1  ORF type:complete len:682 (+),score=119.89 TRINITY_DN6195_c0_g1_i1:26-2047(+)
MEDDAHKPASPTDSQSSQKKRVVVPHACDQCRSNHVKCDGNMPCFRCVKKKLDCSFKRPNKLVDKGRIEELVQMISQLKEELVVERSKAQQLQAQYDTGIVQAGPTPTGRSARVTPPAVLYKFISKYNDVVYPYIKVPPPYRDMNTFLEDSGSDPRVMCMNAILASGALACGDIHHANVFIQESRSQIAKYFDHPHPLIAASFATMANYYTATGEFDKSSFYYDMAQKITRVVLEKNGNQKIYVIPETEPARTNNLNSIVAGSLLSLKGDGTMASNSDLASILTPKPSAELTPITIDLIHINQLALLYVAEYCTDRTEQFAIFEKIWYNLETHYKDTLFEVPYITNLIVAKTWCEIMLSVSNENNSLQLNLQNKANIKRHADLLQKATDIAMKSANSVRVQILITIEAFRSVLSLLAGVNDLAEQAADRVYEMFESIRVNDFLLALPFFLVAQVHLYLQNFQKYQQAASVLRGLGSSFELARLYLSRLTVMQGHQLIPVTTPLDMFVFYPNLSYCRTFTPPGAAAPMQGVTMEISQPKQNSFPSMPVPLLGAPGATLPRPMNSSFNFQDSLNPFNTTTHSTLLQSLSSPLNPPSMTNGTNNSREVSASNILTSMGTGSSNNSPSNSNAPTPSSTPSNASFLTAPVNFPLHMPPMAPFDPVKSVTMQPIRFNNM